MDRLAGQRPEGVPVNDRAPDLASPPRALLPANGAILPLPRHVSPREWGIRAGIWTAIGLAVLLAARFDLHIMAWGQANLAWVPDGVIVWLRRCGEVSLLAIVTAVLACFDRRRALLVAAVLCACLLAGAMQGLGKLAIFRYRPPDPAVLNLPLDAWRTLWQGLDFGARRAGTQAFPSGHTTLAFAFAGVMSWFYPRARWLFLAVAAGCGFARFTQGVHWLSDCIAGAALGYACAWVALRPYVWVLPVIFVHRWRRRRRKSRR